MSFSNYIENLIIDHMLRAQSYSPVATIYAGLHTADPAETGANEVTGGSYVRKAVTLSAASSGASSNSGAITWTDMPAVTVTHVSLWDAESNGNCLMEGALTASKALNAGDTFSIGAGDLDVTVS